jgi:CDP-diacylglycerol--glycerol-3-phosphate 3-phosphatidyltransferase
MWLLGECVSGADPTDADLESRKLSFWATMVFALAAITDFLDGWVARNWNLGSTVGRFLDPLADKLIVMACLVMFVALDRCPAWLPVLALAREISVTTLRTMAMSEGLEIKVNQGGKWKTAFQLCGLIGLMVHYEYPVSWGVVTVDFNFHVIGYWLLILSMIFSMQSAWEYFRGFVVVAAEQRDAR